MKNFYDRLIRPNAGKIFTYSFYALLIIFLVLYIRGLDFAVLGSIDVIWFYVLAGTVTGVVYRYFGAYIWISILRGLGAADIKLSNQLIYVYAKSWLGRYIPGTAPWIIGKIYFASKHGVSKNKLAVSSLLEGVLQILVTLTIAIAILLFDARTDVIDDSFKLILVAVLVAGIVAMIPAVFNRFVALTYKLIRKKKFAREHMATSSTVLRGAGLYVIGALISGLSFFFIAKAIYAPLGFHELLFVLGASNLASAVGMLAIFAPSGIGVREGIQVLLLGLIMPAEFALLIAVVTRIWSVAVDLIFFVLGRIFYRP